MRYLVVIAVGLLLASPAWADFESDKRDCVRGTGRVQGNACSLLLRSGRFGARDLSIIYPTRGLAYAILKQYRRAIQDYNEAIRLNPSLYQAYGNRGLAYEQLGKKQLAIRDYRKVLSLRPGHKFGTAGLKRLGANP